MTFRKVLGHVLTALLAAVLLACCWYGFHVSRSGRAGVRCVRLNVMVKDSLSCAFIAEEDISRIIERECGPFIGKAIDSLDISSIEAAVMTHTAVSGAQVYVSLDSTLNVAIVQRVPFLRFQLPDGGFYVDRDGGRFPLQARGAAAVPVVDGAIPAEPSQEWIDGVVALEKYILSSRTWRDNIVQIHVDKGGDLVLIPRTGKEKFILGAPAELDRKFRQMEIYYTGVRPNVEEGYYSSVSLKFENQLICRK